MQPQGGDSKVEAFADSRARRAAPEVRPTRAGPTLDRRPLTPIGNWEALVRGFAALAVGEGLARVPGVVAIVLLAHRLEPTAFGVAMLGLTLIAWFSLGVDAGTETLGTRDISRQPERLREIAEPVLGLRLALSIGAMVLFAAVAWAVAKEPGDRTVLLLFAVVLPATAVNLRMMIVGVRATTALGFGNVASQIGFLVGIAVFVRGADDLAWVPVLKAAAEIGYGAVIIMALRRRFKIITPRIDLAVWSITLRQSIPLFINGVARVIMFSSGVLLIGVMGVRQNVGLYAAAHRPVVFSAAVSGLLLVSFLASYSAAPGRSDAVRIFRRTVWLGAAAIPFAVAVSATSGVLLRLVYGEAYVAAAPPFALLIWIVPIVLVGGPYGVVLIAANRQGCLLRNNLVGAAFTLVGTIAAVAALGIVGAAAAAVAAQGLVVALNYRTSVRLGVAPRWGVVLTGRERGTGGNMSESNGTR